MQCVMGKYPHMLYLIMVTRERTCNFVYPEKNECNCVTVNCVAVSQVYWPKHEEVDRLLKVECIPVLGETEYPPIFAISTPISPGIFLLLDILL